MCIAQQLCRLAGSRPNHYKFANFPEYTEDSNIDIIITLESCHRIVSHDSTPSTKPILTMSVHNVLSILVGTYAIDLTKALLTSVPRDRVAPEFVRRVCMAKKCECYYCLLLISFNYINDYVLYDFIVERAALAHNVSLALSQHFVVGMHPRVRCSPDHQRSPAVRTWLSTRQVH